jgi:hypothetical protein
MAARFIYRQTGIEARVKNYNMVYTAAVIHVGTREIVMEDIALAIEFETQRKAREDAQAAANQPQEGPSPSMALSHAPPLLPDLRIPPRRLQRVMRKWNQPEVS